MENDQIDVEVASEHTCTVIFSCSDRSGLIHLRAENALSNLTALSQNRFELIHRPFIGKGFLNTPTVSHQSKGYPNGSYLNESTISPHFAWHLHVNCVQKNPGNAKTCAPPTLFRSFSHRAAKNVVPRECFSMPVPVSNRVTALLKVSGLTREVSQAVMASRADTWGMGS